MTSLQGFLVIKKPKLVSKAIQSHKYYQWHVPDLEQHFLKSRLSRLSKLVFRAKLHQTPPRITKSINKQKCAYKANKLTKHLENSDAHKTYIKFVAVENPKRNSSHVDLDWKINFTSNSLCWELFSAYLALESTQFTEKTGQ